ncbi:hypothetical protein [Xenorhabdus stockiae]|uniref:hypothetical protein n=1 Tax=Xenorhabdus stockiae TaxID=351614 RepID=UPI004064C3F3
MNQLDIYLNKDDGKVNHQKDQRIKLVYINEIVKGSFLITEFCNGEVNHYMQKSGEEPVLTNTFSYSEDDSLYPSMATHIYNIAIGSQSA